MSDFREPPRLQAPASFVFLLLAIALSWGLIYGVGVILEQIAEMLLAIQWPV